MKTCDRTILKELTWLSVTGNVFTLLYNMMHVNPIDFNDHVLLIIF